MCCLAGLYLDCSYDLVCQFSFLSVSRFFFILQSDKTKWNLIQIHLFFNPYLKKWHDKMVTTFVCGCLLRLFLILALHHHHHHHTLLLAYLICHFHMNNSDFSVFTERIFFEFIDFLCNFFLLKRKWAYKNHCRFTSYCNMVLFVHSVSFITDIECHD